MATQQPARQLPSAYPGSLDGRRFPWQLGVSVLILAPPLGQEIPMTGIPMQPVYQYPPDPKAGPAPPQPGFMYPPSGPAPQYPLYPAGPPIYNPAGKRTTWNPCSFLSPPLAPGPPLSLLLVDYHSQAPSMSPRKLLGISSQGTCTPWRGESTSCLPVSH